MRNDQKKLDSLLNLASAVMVTTTAAVSWLLAKILHANEIIFTLLLFVSSDLSASTCSNLFSDHRLVRVCELL